MIRSGKELLAAMREHPEFAEDYISRIRAKHAARELLHSGKLEAYFEGEHYGDKDRIGGRRQDYYTVLRALCLAREEERITEEEYLRCFAMLVKENRDLKKSFKARVEALEARGGDPDQLVKECLDLLLKDRIDDFFNSGGNKKNDKVYRDEISLLRAFEEYQRKTAGKTTELRQDTLQTEMRDPQMLQAFCDALKKKEDAEYLILPLETDERRGVGIFLLGREYIVDTEHQKEICQKYPEWYRTAKWYLEMPQKCFICVLHLEEIEKASWNLDEFGDKLSAYADMKYVAEVCPDMESAYEKFDALRTNRNPYADLFFCAWPLVGEPEPEKRLRERFGEYFIPSTPSPEEQQIMEAYRKAEASELKRLEKKESMAQKRRSYRV